MMKNSLQNSRRQLSISPKRKFLFLILILTLVVVPVFLVTKSVIVGFTQTQNKDEKQIKKNSFKKEPVEILGLGSGGLVRKFSQKFQKKKDWLKDLKIKFKNTSGKTISFIEFGLLFPETQSTGRTMYYTLRSGVHPLTLARKNKETVNFAAPNSVSELKLSAEGFTRLKAFLATRQELDSLTVVNIQISVVYFSDGTRWYAGTMWRPDPQRKGRHLPIDDDKNSKKGVNQQ